MIKAWWLGRMRRPAVAHSVWLGSVASAAVILLAGGCAGETSTDVDDAATDLRVDDVDTAEVEPSLDGTEDGESDAAPARPRDELERYSYANTCVYIEIETQDDGPLRLHRTADGTGYTAGGDGQPTPFWARAADLGAYVFYDDERGYLVANEAGVARATSLETAVSRGEAGFVSPAIWTLTLPPNEGVVLQNQAMPVTVPTQADDPTTRLFLTPANGCAEFPELSLDATGEVGPGTWPDGDVYGFVDAHSHILTNFGFGGGGVFHGAPFHPLGVEHAMGDCTYAHAEGGRADLLGWGFGDRAGEGLDEIALISILTSGRLQEDLHTTDGWPTFSGWPSRTSATHQAQYYRWLERAWMSGLRLVVQHAVSNEAFCDLMVKPGYQPALWGCEDMVNIDRQLVEIHNMERYIDAQAGGPGRGFFRVVTSPAEAREAISAGKLAVVLGIEVPNLFSCYLTPRPGSADCTPEYVDAELDRYHEMGVRVLFPNHKYDNAFAPGDGNRGLVELGNFYTTGHWSNFITECPDVPSIFDRGDVLFGGFNQPREDYHDEAPNPLLDFSRPPLSQLLPYLSFIRQGPLVGDHCQKTGLTEIGRYLINGMMDRGIIVELDHLPRIAYVDAFEMLREADYPAAGTHGNTYNGAVYELGGISGSGFSRCADPSDPGAQSEPFRRARAAIEAAGIYAAQGFSFDLNGLAGYPRARFGDAAGCATPQENPVTYPFVSHDGQVTFTEPRVGERVLDFNTEGMIHIGLVAEYIEDARRTGSPAEDLEFLFRSAEGYLRMWEKADERAAARRAQRAE